MKNYFCENEDNKELIIGIDEIDKVNLFIKWLYNNTENNYLCKLEILNTKGIMRVTKCNMKDEHAHSICIGMGWLNENDTKEVFYLGRFFISPIQHLFKLVEKHNIIHLEILNGKYRRILCKGEKITC